MQLTKNKNKKIIYLLGLGLIIYILGLPSYSFAVKKPTSKLTVYVVNYPLKYFAERIAGEHARVVFPAPKEVDPAFWMPDAETIQKYQRADLILLNGAHYAKWVQRVTLPQFRLVNTSTAFKDRYIRADEMITHTHGSEGEHSHEGILFTTWLDFDLATEHARVIEKALSRKKPELSKVFGANLESLERDLKNLDGEMKLLVSRKPSNLLVASHPVYQYLARRYGLNVVSLLWEPDKIPDDREWNKLRAMLKNYPAKWMIWEKLPNSTSIKKLGSMGVESLVFAPCANAPEAGDFLDVMRQNIENLKKAF